MANNINLKNTVIQGGLDPKILLLSEKEIYSSTKKYLDAFKGLPYVFNLGHGMLPETNPEKVDKLTLLYTDLQEKILKSYDPLHYLSFLQQLLAL